jgi:hypothetical protein
MYFGETLHNDATMSEMAQASRKAAENWRFRHLKSKERKVLAAILTTVHRLFVW